MSQSTCPKCGNPAPHLVPVDAALMAKLQEAGAGAVPAQVCESCHAALAGGMARGGMLMAREKAKEQKRLMLWKSRVNLIKKARQCMNEKMFSDAAVAYEKYLKVLEVVFECKSGELSPEHFKDSARTQELTVVASAYWDLLRIYDTSDRYGERQLQTAKKLSQFLRFTPIYPDILRKAEIFVKTAKHPEAIRSFLKMSSENKGRCFIATAAFGYESPEVQILTRWRDQVLLQHSVGRLFVNFYYVASPRIAFVLDRTPWLKRPVRAVLHTFAEKFAQKFVK
jgi:hypothetical protein